MNRPKVAFVGASGYGNIGDDTYPLVFARHLPEYEVVVFNSDLPPEVPADVSMLVIGGGGVLHNVGAQPEDAESPHFRCMKFYMDAAIERGISWGFSSCGFQFDVHADARYATALEPWVPYLQRASFITLRSPACVRIAREISGREDATCFPDAAYLLRPKSAESVTMQNVVTIVPAGLVNPKNALMNHYQRLFDSIQQPVVWMSMGAPVDDGWMFPEIEARFPDARIFKPQGPEEAFAQIASSRLVITGRYHGMVFARSAGVPFLTPIDNPHKIRSEDLARDCTEALGHIDVLRHHLGERGQEPRHP